MINMHVLYIRLYIPSYIRREHPNPLPVGPWGVLEFKFGSIFGSNFGSSDRSFFFTTPLSYRNKLQARHETFLRKFLVVKHNLFQQERVDVPKILKALDKCLLKCIQTFC